MALRLSCQYRLVTKGTKMTSSKKTKVIYWVLTALLMAPAAGGGIIELFTDEGKDFRACVSRLAILQGHKQMIENDTDITRCFLPLARCQLSHFRHGTLAIRLAVARRTSKARMHGVHFRPKLRYHERLARLVPQRTSLVRTRFCSH